MADSSSCAVVLLAAGAARRMGEPKQLLLVKGQPLLRHVAEIVLAAPARPVVAVLGAQADRIVTCLDGLTVEIVINPNWAEGMGGSLRAGMEKIAQIAPGASAVIVILADQPDFSAAHLEKLIALQSASGRTIVATQVGDVLRPPVLFTAQWFPALQALEGDAGARQLLQEHRAEVASVALGVAIDLDTPADYERFRSGLA